MGPPTFIRKTRKSMAGTARDYDNSDSVVPLPESETPMIRKNKELREAQSRRSSLGMRGQRASSSLGRGDISELREVSQWVDQNLHQVSRTLPSTARCSTITSARRCRSLFVYDTSSHGVTNALSTPISPRRPSQKAKNGPAQRAIRKQGINGSTTS